MHSLIAEPGREIRVVNPLPHALAHYQTTLSETLQRVGVPHYVAESASIEGGRGRGQRLAKLAGSLRTVGAAHRSHDRSLVLWTSLGLLDTVAYSSRASRHAVVLHDPIPIRKQVGHDRLSQMVAAAGGGSRAPLIITHSRDARDAAMSLLPRHEVVCVPHPVSNDQTPHRRDGPPTVVVAGQYKPERDVDLLARLGPLLRARGMSPTIRGRGWPPVDGWDVDSRFLNEQQLRNVLGSASAVLIPYRRYFQSGIALRALELGTFSISPRNSFAEDVLPAAAIVDETDDTSSWMNAIEWCIEHRSSTAQSFAHVKAAVDDGWRRLSDNLADPS